MKERTSYALRAVRPLLYGAVTGILSGAAVALFLICARVVLSFAVGIYEGASSALAAVCVVTLVLLCCLIAAVVQTLVPSSKGSGIPMAEGCARGILRVKWLRTAAALIVGSMLSFLSGMPLGSEGPSIGVGGLIGDGVGKVTKKPVQFRRYLITGGASAGLAVAFNAPLTGVAFALEETHRRFSPSILLAAFSAVVPAVLVSQLMFWAFGHNAYLNGIGIRAGAAVFPYLAQSRYGGIGLFFSVCGIAALCGIACAALAVAFNFAVFALGKVFSKIHGAVLRLLPAFALTIICGLALYESVGSGEVALETAYEDAALWLMFVLLAVRFVMTAVASGSGATGGLFIPMIALGGITGCIAAELCKLCGMDAAYAPNMIMLCVSAFFAASVRAPISAIAMSVELTASFANLLPCAIAVAFATAIAGAMRCSPLYEHMMEDLQRRAPVPVNSVDVTVTGTVFIKSDICGKRIRDILWPYNSLVTELKRGEVDIVPDGETTLLVGDRLTVRAERVEPESFDAQIREYITLDDTDEHINDLTEKNR